MKDLLIATIGLWRLWPIAVALGIGWGIGKALDVADAHGLLPQPMRRTWQRLHG